MLKIAMRIYNRPIQLKRSGRILSTSSAQLRSSTEQRALASYPAYRVDADGTVREVNVSKKELLESCRVHMRDLLQLGLDVPFRLRHVNRLPPQLLQRGDSILALVGPFKAIILHDHAYFFGVERSTVRSAVHRLKGLLRLRAHSLGAFKEQSLAYENKDQQREQQQQQQEQRDIEMEGKEEEGTSPAASGIADYTTLKETAAHHRWPRLENEEQDDGHTEEIGVGGDGHFPPSAAPPPPPPLPPPVAVAAFELLVTEHLLDELCGSYQRRMRLFQPVVSKLLLGLTHGSEQDANEGLHRLIPIKTGISNFQMVIDEAVDCLEDLLASDEDLVALLLSERIERRKGDPTGQDKPLEIALHGEVEMMVEAYHRRLVLIKHQVTFLMQRVKSTQEVTAIRIDVARNRIIRTNLHMTMLSVSLATMTTTAGFLGMNLELPGWIDGGFTNPDTAAAGAAAAAGEAAGEAVGVAMSTGGAPFLVVVAVSVVLGAGFYGMGVAHANGMLRRLSGSNSRDVDDVVALGRIFEDMSSIEHAVHEHMAVKVSNALTKDEFRDLLGHETMRDVSSRELELIFEIFDVSNDGVINRHEVEEATEASSAFDPAASISPFAPTKFGQQHIPGGNGNSQRRGLLK